MIGSVLIAACLAFAAPSSGAGHVDVDIAKKLYDAGGRAYKAGRYLAAISVFEEANRLAPRAAIAYSLAQAYRLQYFRDKDVRKLKRAIALYRAYLKEAPDGDRRAHAEEHLSTLEPLAIQTLSLALKNGYSSFGQEHEEEHVKTELIVSSSVLGATVTLGEHGEKSDVPAVFQVKAGRYQVHVEAPGHFDRTVEMVAVDSKVVTVDVDLKPKPALISIEAPSGSEIAVDGRLEGSSPLARPLELGAGRHYLVVAERGRYPYAREVVVDNGDALQVKVDLERTAQRALAYDFLGGGAAFLAAGAVVGAWAFVTAQDARSLEQKEEGPNPRSLTLAEGQQHLVDAHRYGRLVTATELLLAAGALLGATGGVLYFTDDARPPAPPVTAFAGPAGTWGVSVSGGF